MKKPRVKRSPHWPALRRKWLKRHGVCRFCGEMEDLEVHHIKPVHERPDLELSERNLITLCEADERQCHLRRGHLGAWIKINPAIRIECELAGALRKKVRFAE